MFKKMRGIKMRVVLGLAVIAIPWFLRDMVASSLDRDSQDLNAVLIEKEGQQQQAAAGRAERDLAFRLAQVELRLDGQRANPEEVEQKAEELVLESLKDEGAALDESARQLLELLPRVNMPPEQATTAENTAKQAQSVAQELKRGDFKDNLFKDFDVAEQALGKAYADLERQAESDSSASSGQAAMARAIAWIFTAVGAVIAGDWRKVLGGLFGGDESASAAAPDEG